MIPKGYNKCFSELTEEELAIYDSDIWMPRVYDKFVQWLIKFWAK
jgi:hypothetical protein